MLSTALPSPSKPETAFRFSSPNMENSDFGRLRGPKPFFARRVLREALVLTVCGLKAFSRQFYGGFVLPESKPPQRFLFFIFSSGEFVFF